VHYNQVITLDNYTSYHMSSPRVLSLFRGGGLRTSVIWKAMLAGVL